MPTYRYKCEECFLIYENFETSIKKCEEVEPELECPKCLSKAKEKQVVLNGGFELKGPNWFGKVKSDNKKGGY